MACGFRLHRFKALQRLGSGSSVSGVLSVTAVAGFVHAFPGLLSPAFNSLYHSCRYMQAYMLIYKHEYMLYLPVLYIHVVHTYMHACIHAYIFVQRGERERERERETETETETRSRSPIRIYISIASNP